MVEIVDDEHANVLALSSFAHRPACLVLLARAQRVQLPSRLSHSSAGKIVAIFARARDGAAGARVDSL